jgi:hypothetical protein
MNIKYFDNFEGLWRDVTGLNGQVLQYGASGWTNASISGGTSAPASWGSISGVITDQKDLLDYVQSYSVAKNAAISGATKTKITYDSKGLVTAGTDLIGADISGYIDATKISSGLIGNVEFDYLNDVSGNIQTQLNSKQDDSAWIDASGQTITGWASTTTKKIQYRLLGNKTAILQWEIVGTGSVGNSASMTLPFTSSAWGVQTAIYQANQSATTAGICVVNASSSTLNFYPSPAIGSTFSGGQARNLRGQMIINLA